MLAKWMKNYGVVLFVGVVIGVVIGYAMGQI